MTSKLYISYVVCWSLIPWRGEEEVVIQLEWNIFIDDYEVYDARVSTVGACDIKSGLWGSITTSPDD